MPIETANAAGDALVEVRDLSTHFFTDEGCIRAVDGVSFTIPRGKTLCVVGESGCGKSITARSLLQIVGPPGRIVGGQMLFHKKDGTIDLAALPPRSPAIRAIRGRDISMIFQEPMSALSPVHPIGEQIAESVRLHWRLGRPATRKRAVEMLDRVGIPRAEVRYDAYTFQLSGGMRQRACIAMALACKPQLLIADEPTTALDVTTQANILDLIRELQSEMSMSVLFITHDLGVVAEIADEVVVMYLGTIVEQAGVDDIFHDPRHPYTRALLRSIPRLGNRRKGPLEAIRGIVPHPFNRPKGCTYNTRCAYAMKGVCDRIVPPIEGSRTGRQVRCLLYSDAQALQAEPGLAL